MGTSCCMSLFDEDPVFIPAAESTELPPAAVPLFEEYFRLYDQDSDGGIEMAEWIQVSKRLAGHIGEAYDEQVAAEDFHSCDADGDGKLDPHEWRSWWQQRLAGKPEWAVVYALTMGIQNLREALEPDDDEQ